MDNNMIKKAKSFPNAKFVCFGEDARLKVAMFGQKRMILQDAENGSIELSTSNKERFLAKLKPLKRVSV